MSRFTFWYVGSPYTKYPAGTEAAFKEIAKLCGYLVKENIPIFCPITHSHPVAEHSSVPLPSTTDFWLEVDRPLMEAASGLLVVMMETWEISAGLAEEINYFSRAGKPIVSWQQGSYPRFSNYPPISELKRIQALE